jgi:hypothetical protein
MTENKYKFTVLNEKGEDVTETFKGVEIKHKDGRLVEIKAVAKELPQDPKKKKTFADYYSKPEYKARHLAYVRAKVTCKCGKLVQRCNMTKHCQTKKHKIFMQFLEETGIQDKEKKMNEILDTKTKEIDQILENVKKSINSIKSTKQT